MKIFNYSSSLSAFAQNQNRSLGLVPTMGALHAGHLELVKEARRLSDLVLVSIFVNPLQFNNADDLIKYPKSLNEDLKMLKMAGADAVFVPTNEEIYSNFEPVELDISPLDSVFEGLHRPGHFKGVINILSRLFDLTEPSDVFFGLKDLQQCLVVEKLIAAKFAHIHQHNCPTLREESGLAMSSRNLRLSQQGKLKAARIYKELNKIKESEGSLNGTINNARFELQNQDIETEYLNLIELPNMNILDYNEPNTKKALIFAGYLEGIRLIDNLVF